MRIGIKDVPEAIPCMHDLHIIINVFAPFPKLHRSKHVFVVIGGKVQLFYFYINLFIQFCILVILISLVITALIIKNKITNHQDMAIQFSKFI